PQDTPLGHRLLLSFSVVLPTGAPHPNVARLFLNWALSREGQDLMQRIGNTASRRLDVGEVTGLERANPSVTYPPPLNKEVNADYNVEAVGIATETIRY